MSFVNLFFKFVNKTRFFVRAKRICSNNVMFQRQLKSIKRLMSWNGYPRYIANKVIENLLKKNSNATRNASTDNNAETTNQVFVRLPYCGPVGERLVSKCISRILRQLKSKACVFCHLHVYSS